MCIFTFLCNNAQVVALGFFSTALITLIIISLTTPPPAILKEHTGPAARMHYGKHGKSKTILVFDIGKYGCTYVAVVDINASGMDFRRDYFLETNMFTKEEIDIRLRRLAAIHGVPEDRIFSS